jgi:hypothetical protein
MKRIGIEKDARTGEFCNQVPVRDMGIIAVAF